MFRLLSLVILTVSLAACLQAQPAQDVSNIPSTDFQIQTISEELVKPWGIAVLPDGSYLVTEISGALKHIQKNKTVNIGGLPEDIFATGQGGLMGIVLGPDFETNKDLYLSYAYGNNKDNGTAIYKAKLGKAKLKGGTVIFKAWPGKAAGSHFGGRMVFLPDGTLVLTLGDGFAYREDAQKKNTHLGKLVRLNANGSAATSNPFAEDKTAKPEIYSMGHRNPQGLFFDTQTGNLWEHEHGPRGGDELNLIKAGANYGWPIATTGTDYNGAMITPHKSYEGMEPFVHDWVPSIAPSGLTIYRGDMFPQWEGDAFIGALAGKALWRVDLDGTKAIGTTRLLADLEKRVRDVVVDQDGALLVLTESKDGGSLLKITPKK